MTKKPFVVGGLALLLGYAWAAVRQRSKRPVTAELMRFHRREQMKKLRAVLLVAGAIQEPRRLPTAPGGYGLRTELVTTERLRVADVLAGFTRWLERLRGNVLGSSELLRRSYRRARQGALLPQQDRGHASCGADDLLRGVPARRRAGCFTSRCAFRSRTRTTRWDLRILYQATGEDSASAQGRAFSGRVEREPKSQPIRSIAGDTRSTGSRATARSAQHAVHHVDAVCVRGFLAGLSRSIGGMSGATCSSRSSVTSAWTSETFTCLDTASSCGYSPDDTRGGVVNAAAYRAFLLTSASHVFGREEYWRIAERNLAFVLESQNADGSWPYADGRRARLRRPLPHLLRHEGPGQDSHADRPSRRCSMRCLAA